MLSSRSTVPIALTMIMRVIQAQTPPISPAPGQSISSQLVSAIKDNQLDAVKRAIREGASLEEKVNGGFTPLMLAVGGGNTEIVRWVLVAGADPNAKTDAGLTPLMVSVIEGRPTIVGLLLTAGAASGEKNAEGLTALDLANGTKNADVASVLKTFAEMAKGSAVGPTMEDTSAYIKDKLELARPTITFEGGCPTGGTVTHSKSVTYSSVNVAACRLTLLEKISSKRQGSKGCFPMQAVRGKGTLFKQVNNDQEWKLDLGLKDLFLESAIKVTNWRSADEKVMGDEQFSVEITVGRDRITQMRKKFNGHTTEDLVEYLPWSDWETTAGDGYIVAIGTKEEATRVAKALAHAALLCGARKELF